MVVSVGQVVDTRQPARYALGMTTLDRATLEWLIENIAHYDHENDRGARHQTMTFRKNGEDHDFKYYFADDIRTYLVDLIHQGYFQFLPEEAVESHNIEDIKRLEVRCNCGWVDGFDIDHANKTVDEDERKLKRKHDAHVAEELKKVEERFQWE